MSEQSLEGLNYMPPFVVGLPSDGRPSPVGSAIANDIMESDHVVRTISSGLGVAVVQAVGASRQPFILAPRVTIDVLQHTNSALEAAVVTGTLFGAWCFTVAETLNNGVSQYPDAVKTIGDTFPNSVRHFGNALAGLEASDKSNDNQRRLSLARNIGRPILRHARRGLTAVGIGIAPYVGTAGVKGQSRSEIRKLGARLGTDGGLVIGALSGALAATIITVGHNHPEVAQHIESITKDAKLWYGVAGLLMAGEWLNNRLESKRAAEQDTKSVS